MPVFRAILDEVKKMDLRVHAKVASERVSDRLTVRHQHPRDLGQTGLTRLEGRVLVLEERSALEGKGGV